MRRVSVLLFSASLLVATGCGLKRYEQRMDLSLEKLKYEKRLADNLAPPPTDPRFQELGIYVRPPKGLELTKVFQLGDVPPGLYDVEASFIEPQKQQMHIVARNKQAAKKAVPKGQAAPPKAARNDFNADVLQGMLGPVYGVTEEVQLTKLKDETKKAPPGVGAGNKFKRLLFQVATGATTSDVQVYIYKQDPYDVAFVFVFPTGDANKAASKIELTLESFAVGERARRIFSGGSADEEGEGVETGGGVAF
ncbi:hypothetical protein EP7_004409 [Isosphaeraceae bacterium EP7]